MSEVGEADDPTGSETGVALTTSDVSVRSGLDTTAEAQPAAESGSKDDVEEEMVEGEDEEGEEDQEEDEEEEEEEEDEDEEEEEEELKKEVPYSCCSLSIIYCSLLVYLHNILTTCLLFFSIHKTTFPSCPTIRVRGRIKKPLNRVATKKLEITI